MESKEPMTQHTPQQQATGGSAPILELRLRVPDWLRGAWSMRRDRLVLLGLLLIGAALAHRVAVLQEAYFVEDDFLFYARAYHNPLDWSYLTDLHKGHLMPGAMLLIYVQTLLAPYHWAVASGLMVVLQAGASLGLFRLMWMWFGRRWTILIPLTVYTFAPLTLPVLTWWAAALNAVPLQLTMVVALVWLTHYLRSGHTKHAWYVAAAVVVAMSFSVKAMFLPPLLFAVAALFLHRTRSGPLRGALRTLDARPRFWLAMAGLSVGHLVLYLARDRVAPEDDGAAIPELRPSIELAGAMLGETFPVLAVGGPLEWGPATPAGGLVESMTWVVIAAWVVLGLLVLGTLLYRRRSLRAWVLLAGYLVLVDLVPTLIARAQQETTVGYDPRYVAEAALVFAICLALAMWPTREEREASEASGVAVYRNVARPPGGSMLAVVCTLGFVATASYSTQTYAETLSGDQVRWYLDTVRGSVSDIPPSAAVYPHPVPEHVVLPWNGPQRLSSHVLPPLAQGVADTETAERIAEPPPSSTPLMINEEGFLTGAEPAPDSHYFGPAEGEECAPTFDGQIVWDVHSEGGPSHAVGISYTAPGESTVEVTQDTSVTTTVLPAAQGDEAFYVPAPDATEQVVINVEDAIVCVRMVTYGSLVPSAEGDPWSELAEEELDEDELDELEEELDGLEEAEADAD